jgi:putative copper resistance protein D
MTPDSGLVLARFAALVALMAMAGVPIYCLASAQARLGGQARRILAGLAVISVIASLWWSAASVAAMAAMPIASLDRATLLAVLEATPTGTVLALRLASAALLLACLALTPRSLPAALIAFVALATSAWTGHSGAAEGDLGLAQRGLDAVHLGAASLWLGALLVFLASLRGNPDRPRLVERLSAFARTGTVVVVLLAVTGSANALLIGREGWSPTSGWTVLLAAKLALFLAMLGLAGINRWRLTPALAAHAPGAERRLLVSLSLETGCALAIVALVAVLGLLDPAGV